MPKPQPAPKKGDPCPQCGAALVERRAPTPAEYAASVHREFPAALPLNVDTASPEFVAEHGTLAVCTNSACRYRTRYPVEEAKADAPAPREPRRQARKSDDGGQEANQAAAE